MLVNGADDLRHQRTIALLVAFLRRGAAQPPEGLAKILLRNGLEQIVHRAGAHGVPHIFKLLVAGQHNEVTVAFLQRRVNQLQPRRAGHDHIRNDYIRLQAADCLNSLQAVGGCADNLALRDAMLHHAARMLQRQRLVIHKQHPVHFPPPPCECCPAARQE